MSSWQGLASNDQLQVINGRLEHLGENGSLKNPRASLLDSQAILCVQGEDAVKFLQGQCTADIDALEDGQSVPGAICTNKGRVISNFRAFKTADAVLLRMSADIASETLDRIKKYAAFFKAELSVWEAPSVAVAFESFNIAANELPAGICAANAELGSVEFYAEPGHASALLEFLTARATLVSESDWYAMQIRSGQTSINICTLEQYLPHQLNLDRSGAVSFTKGCYTGQEIVARTEYKGKTKRRVLPVLIEADMPDLHGIKLQLDNEAQTEISLLDSASEGEGKTVASLLLPTDQPEEGTILINGQQAGYKLLPLPYSLAD